MWVVRIRFNVGEAGDTDYESILENMTEEDWKTLERWLTKSFDDRLRFDWRYMSTLRWDETARAYTFDFVVPRKNEDYLKEQFERVFHGPPCYYTGETLGTRCVTMSFGDIYPVPSDVRFTCVMPFIAPDYDRLPTRYRNCGYVPWYKETDCIATTAVFKDELLQRVKL